MTNVDVDSFIVGDEIITELEREAYAHVVDSDQDYERVVEFFEYVGWAMADIRKEMRIALEPLLKLLPLPTEGDTTAIEFGNHAIIDRNTNILVRLSVLGHKLSGSSEKIAFVRRIIEGLRRDVGLERTEQQAALDALIIEFRREVLAVYEHLKDHFIPKVA